MALNNLLRPSNGPLLTSIGKAKDEGRLVIAGFGDLFSSDGIGCTASASLVDLVLIDQSVRDGLRAAAKLIDAGDNTSQSQDDSEQNPDQVHLHRRYEGSEHQSIGNSATLRDADGNSKSALDYQLILSNGCNLRYGQIVSLAGDFFGIPWNAISGGTDLKDRQNRFKAFFDNLATRAESVGEVRLILQAMQYEIDAVNRCINQGQPPAEAYESFGEKLNAIWNAITGGGAADQRRLVASENSVNDKVMNSTEFNAFNSFVSLLHQGRYLELASSNFDHFQHDAYLAYEAGHALAMQTAVEASGLSGQARADKLMTAYAMNAFADHYLSDMFAAGHIRTPRKLIYDTANVGVTANLCAKGMHDEDNKNGIVVTNQNGRKWRAYGDGHYFIPQNGANRFVARKAIQISVDEIYNAFANKAALPIDKFAVQRLTPTALESGVGLNYSAMFINWKGEVQRRYDLEDLNDFNWSWWFTATTAKKLNSLSTNRPAGYIDAPGPGMAVAVTGQGSGAKSSRRFMLAVQNNVTLFCSDFSPPTEAIQVGDSDVIEFSRIAVPKDAGNCQGFIFMQTAGGPLEGLISFPFSKLGQKIAFDMSKKQMTL